MARVFRPTQLVRQAGKVIGRRPTKNWYVEWTDHTGRTRRESAGPDKAVAQAVLAAKVNAATFARAGLPAPGRAAPALAEVVDRYLAARRSEVGAKHFDDLESVLNRIMAETGARTTEELSEVRVQQYLDDLAAAGCCGRTMNRHLGIIQACLCASHPTLLPVAHPVTRLAKRPQRQRCRIRRALTHDEARRLLAASEADERLPYMLALYTGIRQKEMGLMRWGDVDFMRGELIIRPEIEKAGRGATLPLPARLANALADAYRKVRPEPSTPLVTLARRPAERLAATLGRAGVAYRDEADRVADFHALRHTCLTWINDAGCDPRTLQALARHASPSTTLGIYVHPERSRMREAVDRLPDLDESEEDRAIA